LNGRLWECISLDDQAIICKQYYQENDKRPSFLTNSRPITSEQLEKYRQGNQDSSLKSALTDCYYLARLEAFFAGYNWDEVVAMETINEAKWGHIHGYRQLAEIASKRNLKLDI
jgi:hypothetical protein